MQPSSVSWSGEQTSLPGTPQCMGSEAGSGLVHLLPAQLPSFSFSELLRRPQRRPVCGFVGLFWDGGPVWERTVGAPGTFSRSQGPSSESQFCSRSRPGFGGSSKEPSSVSWSGEETSLPGTPQSRGSVAGSGLGHLPPGAQDSGRAMRESAAALAVQLLLPVRRLVAGGCRALAGALREWPQEGRPPPGRPTGFAGLPCEDGGRQARKAAFVSWSRQVPDGDQAAELVVRMEEEGLKSSGRRGLGGGSTAVSLAATSSASLGGAAWPGTGLGAGGASAAGATPPQRPSCSPAPQAAAAVALSRVRTGVGARAVLERLGVPPGML